MYNDNKNCFLLIQIIVINPGVHYRHMCAEVSFDGIVVMQFMSGMMTVCTAANGGDIVG